MTIASTAVLEFAGFGVCAMAVAAVTDSAPPEAQGWTVLGLLAVVVVGVGFRMVKAQEESGNKTAAAIEKSNDRVVAALDRHAEAQSQTATNLALLIRESQDSREEGAEKRRQILERLDQVPERVAAVLRK